MKVAIFGVLVGVAILFGIISIIPKTPETPKEQIFVNVITSIKMGWGKRREIDRWISAEVLEKSGDMWLLKLPNGHKAWLNTVTDQWKNKAK